ncbi:MAG TPA: hypothetical protein DCO79_05050, partial [Spirochaeta sp.]|nr:hypothetical protein [Spirochaeta sp.]
QNDLLVSIMNKAVSAVCLSEIEQDSEPGNYFIDRAAYFSRIRGKTAELFALSCRVGAVLGGADEKFSEEFYDVGLNFGLAFQIMDDVLDYRGSSDRMGKPVGNDLKAGIPTLPLILALESGDTTLERFCRSRNKYRLRAAIRKRVLKGGFDKAAAVIGEEYLGKCLDKLQSLEFQDRDLFAAVISSLNIREL